MTHDNKDMVNDPIYQKMIAAIEQAKEYNITPISISIGPFEIPIVESADVPKNTIAILQPKRIKGEATRETDPETGRSIFVARFGSTKEE